MGPSWRPWVSGLLLALGVGFFLSAVAAQGYAWWQGALPSAALATGVALAVLVLVSAGILALGISKGKTVRACLLLLSLYGCLLLSGAAVFVLALIAHPPDVPPLPSGTCALGLGLLPALGWVVRLRSSTEAGDGAAAGRPARAR